MARTRSAGRRTPATTTPDVAATEEIPRPSSFNGALARFQYASNSVPRATESTQPTTAGLNPRSSSRPSLKRSLDGDDIRAEGSTDSPSPAKKRRESRKYAPPSKYSHLPPLKDILEPNLICVFVGTNPGIRTARDGHAYAHPSNLFWKLLHSSGCTDRRCRPEEDVDLPRLYAMGNTNIVERPTKDAAELLKAEMVAGTPILEAKIQKFKPEAVCIVGKGIWEAIWRYRYGRAVTKEEFQYGWQDEKENMGKDRTEEEDVKGDVWCGARVFVATSTSGLSASTRPAEKEAIWKSLGEWVAARRTERSQEAAVT